MFLVIVLDTSFLIALYLSEDSNHTEALKLFINDKNELFTISDLILEETLTVLNYKKDIEFTRIVYSELLSTKNIIITSSAMDKNSIIDIFFSQKKQLSFQDASIVYQCLKTNARLFTFDNDMEKELEIKKLSKS